MNSLKLAVGKTYLSADGQPVKIVRDLEFSENCRVFQCTDGYGYLDNGECPGRYTRGKDLVSEVPEDKEVDPKTNNPPLSLRVDKAYLDKLGRRVEIVSCEVRFGQGLVFTASNNFFYYEDGECPGQSSQGRDLVSECSGNVDAKVKLQAPVKARAHADVIKAWADGAEVEIQDKAGNWSHAASPMLPDNAYRIKPEKPQNLVRWLPVYPPGSAGFWVGGGYTKREKACQARMGLEPLHVLRLELDAVTGDVISCTKESV